MPIKVSLRQLARALGVSHGAISDAIHTRRLTRGVRIDEQGRATVDDAQAAATEWRATHARQPGLERVIVLTDHAMSCEVTAAQLFAERDALSVLVTALASSMLDGADDRDTAATELKKRIAARLRTVAEMHGADEHTLTSAGRDLETAIGMLHDAEDDEALIEPEGDEP